ncbi:MAG: hypothetical protein OXU77_11970 [Gammaproteobacteria bacterium]|nr:hypothetical protein [Gammaproteobacteria bacterium]MDE0191097.1 hypothetical protein [Gammaproteobacteria bacterium]
MKRLDEFTAEETGEEWLRELYKVVAQRRGVMFRLITESTRLLLLGNAGGAGLIIGLMSAAGGGEDAAYHWIALLTLVVFGVGVLSSALTMILVSLVAIREAHGAETGLKRFVDGEIDRSEVMFVVEEQTFRIADFATVSGVVSAVCFMAGGLAGIVLLTLFF